MLACTQDTTDTGAIGACNTAMSTWKFD